MGGGKYPRREKTLAFKCCQDPLLGVPIVAQQVKNLTVSVTMWAQSLASLSELRIQHCHERQCRSQLQLGSCVAVAVLWAGSCSSDETPRLGTSICCGSGPAKTKNKKHTTVAIRRAPPQC